MSEHPTSAYLLWKEANDAARLKEGELHAAWLEFFDRRQAPPSDALIAEAAGLRKRANELLQVALEAGKDRRAPG
jgi:hypothetical protein